MRRSTVPHLAAYFGDLIAIAGIGTLAADLVDLRTPAWNLPVIADLSLVAAGLSAHRIARSSLRDAPALALGLLIGGAAPSVLILGRWWLAASVAAIATALAPHLLPPPRARAWVAAGTLLGVSALRSSVPLGVVVAACVLAIGIASARLARRLRRTGARLAHEREQALVVERQRTADLMAQLARYEGRVVGPRSAFLRTALSRRLGTIGAIATSLARELREPETSSQSAPEPRARRGAERAEQLAALAAGSPSREHGTTLSLIWPQVCDAIVEQMNATHHLDAKLPATLPPLVGTAHEWEHILIAGMENALRALPSGGVIRVRAGRADQAGVARIVIEDTGPGTTRDALARAGDRDLEESSLATAAALVEVLGGEVRVGARQGGGTRLTIEAPFYTPPASARPAEPARLAGTVLLADDDRDVRRALGRLLESLGLTAVEADTGTVALAQFSQAPERFRAVMLDVVMGGTPVGDVVASMRQRRPGLPVVLVSGYDTRGFVDSVLALGGVRFLQKPVERADLIAALNDLLDVSV